MNDVVIHVVFCLIHKRTIYLLTVCCTNKSAMINPWPATADSINQPCLLKIMFMSN